MSAPAPHAAPAHSFYLSSPLLGLKRERALVQQWISERQQACRHSYAHHQEPPVASCRAEVRRSDRYLLMLAARYGTSQPEHDHKSVTELEFEAAQGIAAAHRQMKVMLQPGGIAVDALQWLRWQPHRLRGARPLGWVSGRRAWWMEMRRQVGSDLSGADASHAADPSRCRRERHGVDWLCRC